MLPGNRKRNMNENVKANGKRKRILISILIQQATRLFKSRSVSDLNIRVAASGC